ncbi:TerD family protein [uncultured Brevibacillus sp.]|uniref:TerD family protein n=1 Tax=uncultured Brevibacillus sp. TaxID=169970 RepID=UPI002594A7D4|nr:TerD family protein [uncultured Brevibacillus sp.]
MVIKGQKVEVTKSFPGIRCLTVGLGWNESAGIDIDASAFLLGAHGKVNQEEDFVFYGNPSAGQNSVCLLEGTGDKKQFGIDITKVPSNVEKIAFTLTIYEAINRRQTFGQVSNAYLRIVNQDNGQEIIRFNIDQFTVENSIVVGELYRYKGDWKFNAIGSGFDGGLAALCNNFGVEVDAQTTPPPVPTPGSPPQPPTLEPINLSKVELKKKGDSISLKKTNGELGEILVNLNWNQTSGGKRRGLGFLNFGEKGNVDLDLGCLFELHDGSKGCVQALGERFGNYHDFPFISLDGDDRTGTKTNGENLRINGSRVDEIKRILIYAYIYDGVASWSEADGVVSIKQADNPEIEVRLDVHDPRKTMCAIAMIENQNGQTFSIRRLVDYFSGHSEMDRTYRWGLRWVAGSKD